MNDATLVFWQDILNDTGNDPAKLRDFVHTCIEEALNEIQGIS